MMNKSNLTLIFDGSALETGEIDVQDLAPALLSLGELIRSANHEINGTQAQLSVCVRATAQGSFEVNLSVLQSFVEKTKSLFDFISGHKEGITTTNELLQLIFGVGSVGIGGGLLSFLKFLKGRKPDKIETIRDNIQVHIKGNVFVTDKQTIQLAQSIPVREEVRKVVAALSKEGIDRLKIKHGNEETLQIDKDEIGYFDLPDSEKEIEDITRTMILQIISLSFKEDNKWRVTDGGDSFSVTIEDLHFLERISNNEVFFAKGDCLKCEVRERQFQTLKGLRKERSILRVVEHEHANQKERLF